MRTQDNFNDIDSQVLIAQSAVTTVHELIHLCYHRGHQAVPILISLKSQKNDPAKSRVKNRD